MTTDPSAFAQLSELPAAAHAVPAGRDSASETAFHIHARASPALPATF